MSRRAPILALQGWLLAILLPALGLLIVAYAILTYARLHAFILTGFDRKLAAISTTTAAFIDPADHERLVEPLPLGSLTRDPAASALWGLDSSEHRFLKIRPTDGLAEETGIAVSPDINNITNGVVGGELYLVDNAAGHVQRFLTSTGRATQAFDLTPPLYALATDMARHVMYAAGRTLRRIDLNTKEITEVGPSAQKLRDLTWDSQRQVLWGLGEFGNELLEIDPTNAAIRTRKKLVLEKADPADASPPQPAELQTLVYDPDVQTLLGTSTSLARIDRDTGLVSTKGFLAAFGQEQGPVYARYVTPMTRIMARANLTYLYTQIVQGRDHIINGLDGTVGKFHSPLLSTDTVREAEVEGVQRLMTEGSFYVSDIVPWPPWGILKSAFAPIFNSQGRPVGMAGADVNAGTIQFQLRRALVITFGLGAALLILGGALTWAIARGLTDPLHVIRTAALRATAGDYSQRAEIARPRELRHLAQRFTVAAAMLGRESQDLQETLSVRQEARDRAALAERLAHLAPLVPSAPPGAPWAWGVLGPRQTGPWPTGGAVQAADRTLAWMAHPSVDPLGAAARRAEIAVTAEALLGRHDSDPAGLGAALEKLFLAEVSAWALLTPAGLQACVRAPGLLFRRGSGGRCLEIAAPDFAAPLRPGPGEALILAGPGAPLKALPAAFPADRAAALLAAWRTGAAEKGPRTFAVICVSSSP